eukprot:2069736-Pyramimonas_sp.AAC.1
MLVYLPPRPISRLARDLCARSARPLDSTMTGLGPLGGPTTGACSPSPIRWPPPVWRLCYHPGTLL